MVNCFLLVEPLFQGLSRSHGELTEERNVLSRQQGDHVARILELEDDIQIISEKVLTKEVELDRFGDYLYPHYLLLFS